MIQSADTITLSVPRTVLAGLVELSGDMTDRLHALPEKNTEGQLSEAESAELSTLVKISQLGEIAATALRSKMP